MPPGLSAPDIPSKQKNLQWPLTELRISVPVTCPSAPLEAVSNCPGVSVQLAAPHQMVLTLNRGSAGRTANLAPEHSLVIRW